VSDASAYEQYLLELINRSRASSGLQPLAMNFYINEAADLHSAYQLAVNKLTHTGSGGTSASTRMTDAGFNFNGSSTWGENVGWQSISGTASYQDEVDRIHTWLMNSPGHRANLLNGSFREVGLGVSAGFFQGYNSVIATEDFATAKGNAFVTGVAFDDRDGDLAYDPGEGLSGVTLRAVNLSTGAVFMAAGGSAGGYSLQLPAGTYSYTFAADGFAQKSGTVTIGTSNVKLDWVDPAAGPPATLSNIFSGTGYGDRLIGNPGADTLYGHAGDDILEGRAGADRLVGGTGNDTYHVEDAGDAVVELTAEGSDTVYSRIASYTLPSNVETLYLDGSSVAWEGVGNELSNKLYGNTLDNHLVGGAGNDLLSGRKGADTMEGGAGNDSFYVDTAGDKVVELTGEGADLVSSTISFTLSANVEDLTLTGTSAINGTGNGVANILTGNTGANVLTGLDGDDQLVGNSGNDRLDGGAGADTLRGGTGTDTLTGGAGADRFDWDSASHIGKGSAGDKVVDFTQGEDRIDLAGIDAVTGTSTNNSFSFIGSEAFHGAAGELRYAFVTGGTLVQGDTNGDKVADFELLLTNGQLAMQATDFVL
jgi:serralysin